VNLIGQFGVGFYSGYLVADKMTVASKSAQAPDSKQYVWESQAGSSFTVKEDTEGTQIEGSGTRITLHLKEDCDEYTDEFKLRDMLRRYSSFIQFPIELWAEKTEYEQVPDTDAPADEGADGEEGDEGDEPKEPKMKTVSKTVTDWELVNSQKPIWLRSPKEVNATEYAEFYKSTFKAYDEPTAHTHFSLEGQVEFKALLYVPSVVPFELNRDMFNENSKAVKLYVKRVFINDKFEELMPRWLTFVRGIVDSEDLPLNVGREILQKSKMLSVINKRLVRKSIDMFKDIESKVSA
jgi:molecular chaperone HtpG